MNAPVCPISRDQAVSLMPGTMLPAVQRATDLTSLIKAVNALRQLLQNAAAPVNAQLPRYQNTVKEQAAYVADQPDWREISRDTSELRVYNKTDRTIFVDVLRITKITFQYNLLVDATESFIWQYAK